ncbi:hypothetical protein [Actinophytocola sp. NPDC049390]|uniref:hypothetical protein n=1 Tax=Actinophytocola sp. NPDC049390 TaxID=3363894 RepID=UPI00378D238C
MERQGGVTYLISEDGRPVTSFTTFSRTPCEIDGVGYGLTHEDRGRFWLEGPTGTAAFAYRTGRGEVLVSATPHELYLRRAGRFGRRWELYRDGQVAGTFTLSVFGARTDLPDDLPLPLRVFAFYVVIITDAGFILWF